MTLKSIGRYKRKGVITWANFPDFQSNLEEKMFVSLASIIAWIKSRIRVEVATMHPKFDLQLFRYDGSHDPTHRALVARRRVLSAQCSVLMWVVGSG